MFINILEDFFVLLKSCEINPDEYKYRYIFGLKFLIWNNIGIGTFFGLECEIQAKT